MGLDAELLKEILETWPEYDPDQEILCLYRVEEEPWVERQRN